MDGSETRGRRARLAPEEREREIVRSAIAFFARKGFGGQTRELAQSIGVSQSLIFRYFPTKEALVERVYEEVFGKARKPDPAPLSDLGVPLEDRLVAFYRDYAGLILGHDYTRLLLFAALGDVNYHDRLFQRIAADVYPAVIDALRAHQGRVPIAEEPPSLVEIEGVWGLHAQIFFLGIREHVFGLPVPPIADMVALKVRGFLKGLEAPAA